jgi:hypothetical protein
MDPSKVKRGEMIAIAGGLLLALGVFLKWYSAEGANVTLAGHGAGKYSAWQVHKLMRYLLLLAALAPLILAWIVARDHALSWPRGEMTSVVAITAIGLIFYNGVIDRPGDPSSLVHLKFGWFVALLGAFGMLAGSVQRQNESERKRKPPGMI